MMSHRIRPTAAWLALVAMLLRALVPAGWMPGAAAGSPLVLCTANGLVQMLDPAAMPDAGGTSPTHSPAADGTCPFGAATTPALPTAPAVTLRGEIRPEPPVASARSARWEVAPTGAHAPRAPPASLIA